MVTVVPTLVRMAEIYRLPREGGNASPRFHEYLKHVEHDWGFVAYNPMAGDAAAEAVNTLIALDAEARTLDAATAVVEAANHHGPITLAVIVRSTGMWTDRIATTIQVRTAPTPQRNGHGLVQLWSRETITVAQVRIESAAECARILWYAEHGAATTVSALISREGAAYATAARITGESLPYGAASREDRASVDGALELLAESREQSDAASILFGDAGAVAMGWTPLGVPDGAGYRVAIERALSG